MVKAGGKQSWNENSQESKTQAKQDNENAQ